MSAEGRKQAVERLSNFELRHNEGPASYFPSIEKKYGRPIARWQELVRSQLPAKHRELVAMLKAGHGMGHGHANALVAHTLAALKA